MTALVLTFNSPELLTHCLAAVSSQTVPPRRVLVVDNASAHPVDDLVDRVPGGQVLRLADNLGPAGGHAAGLRAFLESDSEWAWIMDDDCVPRPDALARQLALALERPGRRVVMATMVERDAGHVTNTEGWCCVLLPRAVVEAVGVPRADFFWWVEDTEYLQWRIPRAGFEVVRSETATVAVGRDREDESKPAWKYYYEVRNLVYYRMWIQRPSGPGDRKQQAFHRRFGKACRSTGRFVARVVVRERSRRADKLVHIARGVYDGATGRLGRTITPSTADRPLAPTGK
ncbi:MAG TPA: glycosyltransferase [Acidimicrobiia bacterium]